MMLQHWEKRVLLEKYFYFCPSRGVARYLEAKEQFDREVLLNDEYYNGIINVRVGGSKNIT